jgi:hypothetical protein
MKIVSIDPGGRNCGIVVLECKDGEPTILIADLKSIAYKKDSMLHKIKQTKQVLRPYIQGADVVVVENQNFGKRHSTIDNVIFQTVIMSMGLECGAEVAVLDSRSKKNKFEKYGFNPQLPSQPKKKKRKYNQSRSFGKKYARELAFFLSSRMQAASDDLHIAGCEHRSDALCLAAVYLLQKGKLMEVAGEK